MKLDNDKATRNPQGSPQKPDEVQTEFQLHKSQLNVPIRNLIDYTEIRLVKYLKQLKDKNQASTIKSVLDQYKMGFMAVCWKNGRPHWMKITKESR